MADWPTTARWSRSFSPFFVVLQVARFWVLATLGRRWTIRVIVVPGERLVAQGPCSF